MPTKRKIGPFDCIHYEVNPNAPTIVLFHGYGADAADLSGLASYVKTQKPLNWVFPEGPLAIDIGMGMQGRAWFPLDVMGLENALGSGSFETFIQTRREGLDHLQAKANEFLKALDIPIENLYLGGFSQGSMLAVDTCLRQEKTARGLVILSGTLVEPKEWGENAKKHMGMRFFQSHGESDPLLPVEFAGKLEKVLKDGGLEGNLIRFPGGHEIPPNVLHALKDFLNA